ncbi:hypothetical protein KW429_11465 [Vibrio fluvialis]|nr:hypothetical protein [Vibrio fluvialis]
MVAKSRAKIAKKESITMCESNESNNNEFDLTEYANSLMYRFRQAGIGLDNCRKELKKRAEQEEEDYSEDLDDNPMVDASSEYYIVYDEMKGALESVRGYFESAITTDPVKRRAELEEMESQIESIEEGISDIL